VATVAATATYPAMVMTMAGRATGAVSMIPLIISSDIPISFNIRKNFGVGAIARNLKCKNIDGWYKPDPDPDPRKSFYIVCAITIVAMILVYLMLRFIH